MVLLERDVCLDELAMVLQDAVGGADRLTLVSGEAGIGKTSLGECFTRERRGSVRVLWGACDALYSPHPLGSPHDMAGQMQGDVPALGNSNAKRPAIFSAMLSELQGRPAIVAFEHVYGADEATLDLLRFLGRWIVRTTALPMWLRPRQRSGKSTAIGCATCPARCDDWQSWAQGRRLLHQMKLETFTPFSDSPAGARDRRTQCQMSKP